MILGLTQDPGNPLGGRCIGWFLGLGNNNSRIPETGSRDPETEPGSLETELRVHMAHWKRDHKAFLAAWWPSPEEGLVDFRSDTALLQVVRLTSPAVGKMLIKTAKEVWKSMS